MDGGDGEYKLLSPVAGGQRNTTDGLCDMAQCGSGSVVSQRLRWCTNPVVQLGNQQALPGFVAAVPGATVLGACGRLFAATTRLPNANTWASGFASLDRCARSLALCPCG